MRGICEWCQSLNSVELTSKPYKLTSVYESRKSVFTFCIECVFANIVG